ncbi:acetate--CoA ligase family protein [Chloroflexota bacterium]
MSDDVLAKYQPLMYPKSIAVVGATEKPKAGRRFLETMMKCGYDGMLYPVNPEYKEILGLKCYPNVASIPQPVDYVIISIPYKLVLDALDDCARNRAKIVHIFSAGFAESGTDAGRRMEEKLKAKAKQGGFRIIGPNCMGLYNAANKGGAYGIGEVALREVGPVGFVSQSGGHAAAVIDELLARGVGFTQVASFGNGCDLKAVDFLEYFKADTKTDIIGAYFEGIEDGPAFMQLAKQITKTKPLLIWKGGKTGAGAEAAASHTGSLAGSYDIWTAAIKQIGAIKVENLEEMVDTIIGLRYLPNFKGNRVAIIGGVYRGGGGFSVSASDACVSAGLDVPEIEQKTRDEIIQYVNPAGAILRNPIDIGPRGPEGRLPKIIEAVCDDPNIDLVIVDPTFLTSGLSDAKSRLVNSVVQLADSLADIKKRKNKPIVNIFSKHLDPDMQGELMRSHTEAQIPVYPTLERAAAAIVSVGRYFRNR